MADRHNLCLNPAIGVAVTGWGGGSTPVRTAVTGFVRPWAARYTAGTFASTAATATGAVTPGLTYTLSVYLRPATFTVGSAAIYIEWINAGGSGFGYPSATASAPAGTVTRLSITAVAPANAVACRAIVDGANFGVNTCDLTALLIEQAAALDVYFDGDTTPGGSWDGTPGLSASTLTTSQTASGSTALPAGPALTPAGSKGSPATTAVRSVAALATATTKGGVAALAVPAGAAATTRGVKGGGGQPAVKSTALLAAAGLKSTAGQTAAAAGASLAAAGAKHARGSTAMAASVALTARHAPQGGEDITIRLGPTRRRWSARTTRR